MAVIVFILTLFNSNVFAANYECFVMTCNYPDRNSFPHFDASCSHTARYKISYDFNKYAWTALTEFRTDPTGNCNLDEIGYGPSLYVYGYDSTTQRWRVVSGIGLSSYRTGGPKSFYDVEIPNVDAWGVTDVSYFDEKTCADFKPDPCNAECREKNGGPPPSCP